MDKKHVLVPSVIFIVALLLRLNNFESWFEWSGIQSSYFWEIRQLAHGHLTLVGFDAGSIGGLRFPPFQLYLLTPIFLLFSGNPLAMDAFLIILGATTCTTFYLVGRAIFGERVGVIVALIYTFSLGAITIDRKFNGSTFVVIFTLATTGYLYKLLRKKTIKPGQMVILSSIIGLGLSMHYQIFFLLLAVLAILFWQKKITILSANLGVFLFTIFLWLSPLLFFDMRHQFYTIRGLFLLHSAHTASNPSGFVNSAQYIVSNFLQIIFKPSFTELSSIFASPVVAILFALVIIFAPLTLRSNQRSDVILKFFVLMSFLGFALLSFYRGYYNFDYYYWYLIPGFIFTVALLVDKLGRRAKPVAILAVILFLVLNIRLMTTYRAPDSYQLLDGAVDAILADAQAGSESKVTVQFAGMQAAQTDYLFYFNSPKFHISPANITLIADNDLFVERLLTKLPPPVVMVGLNEARNIKAKYLFQKSPKRPDDGKALFYSYYFQVYKLPN